MNVSAPGVNTPSPFASRYNSTATPGTPTSPASSTPLLFTSYQTWSPSETSCTSPKSTVGLCVEPVPVTTVFAPIAPLSPGMRVTGLLRIAPVVEIITPLSS